MPTEPRPRTFADKLNFLFATVRPAGESREYTNTEIGEAIGVAPAYIGRLRRGMRDNPTIDNVKALARLFRVRLSYLVDELDAEQIAHVEWQLRLQRAFDKPGVKKLAMRVADANLSAEALETLTAMVEQVCRLEQPATNRNRPSRPSS